MDELEALWHTTFRDAVLDLLSLSESELEKLESLTKEGFALAPGEAEGFSLPYPRLSLAVRSLGTLYSLTGASPSEQVVTELIKRAKEETEPPANLEAKAARLRALLETRPVLDEARKRVAIEHSMLPTFERLALSLDLRAVEDSESEVVEFFPVLLARMEFDENVQSGDVVTFQLAESDLALIETALADTRELLERWRRQTEGSPSDG